MPTKYLTKFREFNIKFEVTLKSSLYRTFNFMNKAGTISKSGKKQLQF